MNSRSKIYNQKPTLCKVEGGRDSKTIAPLKAEFDVADSQLPQGVCLCITPCTKP